MTLFQATLDIDLRSRVDEIASVTEYTTAIEGGIQAIIIVAGLATFFYLVWGGLDWLMSGGDSGKVEAARKKMTQAAIGLALLMSVAAIFFVIQYVLGISILGGGGAPAGPALGRTGQACVQGSTCASGICSAGRCL